MPSVEPWDRAAFVSCQHSHPTWAAGLSHRPQTPPAAALPNRFIVAGEENETMWSCAQSPRKKLATWRQMGIS